MRYLALALFLTGCGTPPPFTANVKTGGSPTFRASVESTILKIESGVKEIGFLRDPEPDLRVNISANALPAGTLGQAWIAEDFDESCNIEISSDVVAANDPEDLTLVVIHEIGHCFGLSHSDEPSDIMHAFADDRQRNPESLERFYKTLNEARRGLR